jgi:hypothetical protein
MSRYCLQIRCRNTHQSAAILELLDAIPHTSRAEASFTSAFDSYVARLDQIERRQEEAAGRAGRAGSTSGKRVDKSVQGSVIGDFASQSSEDEPARAAKRSKDSDEDTDDETHPTK